MIWRKLFTNQSVHSIRKQMNRYEPKLLMYTFNYEHMLPKYGYENIKLLFTDTDSLTYHIKTKDLYKDMK